LVQNFIVAVAVAVADDALMEQDNSVALFSIGTIRDGIVPYPYLH
jgi:hypothetical protein